MCTAISYVDKEHYFGRNLDLEYSYEEAVVIMPRKFPLPFRMRQEMTEHYAMIGTAYVVNGYPLYYDGGNERGLCMAGLMFANNAGYVPFEDAGEEKEKIAVFELIPRVLGTCSNIKEAREVLKNIILTDTSFGDELPVTPLHWILADASEEIVIESTKEGLNIYDNPVGVLTNNPPFPYHLYHLEQYCRLGIKEIKGEPKESWQQAAYSKGLNAKGLPGDLSSASRYVRASFHKKHSVSLQKEEERVHQFFHLLGSVEMPLGSVETEEGLYEHTVYSSCINATRGIYYYKTYFNNTVMGIAMEDANLDETGLYVYKMLKNSKIPVLNREN